MAEKTTAKTSETKVLAKKLDKKKKEAFKRAAKTKLRVKERKSPKADSGRPKEKAACHAPQATRITEYKGERRAVASTTVFAPTVNGERNWLLVDATDKTVGRLASEIAMLLRGKHKATFTPNNDVGDFVVVLNAKNVKFSNNKDEDKKYYRHTGYAGGIKEVTAARLRETYPERILENAVKGMISRNPLGRRQMKKLKIYAGETHPHAAQNPVAWSLRYS